MDASVVGPLEALTRRESENVYEKIHDAIDRASGSTEAVGLPPAFVCRGGGGRYRCWWGEDEVGRTVAFVVQFDAIDVIEQLLVEGPELVEGYFDERIG
jgi:hypothetical protein